MKKGTKKALPFWIILFVLGLILLILGLVLKFPSWITWLTTLLLWGGCSLWLTLHFVLGALGKTKKGDKFVGNRALYDRVAREINEAINRYLQSIQLG